MNICSINSTGIPLVGDTANCISEIISYSSLISTSSDFNCSNSDTERTNTSLLFSNTTSFSTIESFFIVYSSNRLSSLDILLISSCFDLTFSFITEISSFNLSIVSNIDKSDSYKECVDSITCSLSVSCWTTTRTSLISLVVDSIESFKSLTDLDSDSYTSAFFSIYDILSISVLL